MAPGWLLAAVPVLDWLFCLLPLVLHVLSGSPGRFCSSGAHPPVGRSVPSVLRPLWTVAHFRAIKCLGPWANPVSLVDRIHDRITSHRVINIIWVLINFKLWKEVFMSSKRYCLQKELSWGVCNLFGSCDTSEAWQENFFQVSGKGRWVPRSSKICDSLPSQPAPPLTPRSWCNYFHYASFVAASFHL